MKRTWTTTLFLVLLGLASACSREDEFSKPDPPTAPEAALLPPGGQKAEVIARFGPVVVTKADLVAVSQEGADQENEVKLIALRRKLASMALAEGLGEKPSVKMAWYQGLARRWLEQKFEVEHTAESVSMERWQKLYNDRRVRPQFDHRDTYFVRDAQITCCSETGFACRKTNAYEKCFQSSSQRIQEAATQLQLLGPITGDEFEKAVKKIANTIPGLGPQKYSFQYDFSKPFERQRGYNVIDEAIARAARETPVGSISVPIRSAFGWHVLFVEKFLPEVYKPFGDPEVMEALKSQFHGMMRDEDVMRYVAESIKQFGIHVDVDALRSANWEKLSGLQP